jgi:hypothetical protein
MRFPDSKQAITIFLNQLAECGLLRTRDGLLRTRRVRIWPWRQAMATHLNLIHLSWQRPLLLLPALLCLPS